ncbi:creatininase family protein [Streptococcus dentasini]
MARYYRELTRLDMEVLNKEETIVMIPLGAIEQHGNHAPLGTDDLIAEKMANLILQEVNQIDENFPLLILPNISIGLSTEHANFCGSLTFSTETYYHMLKEIIESLYHHGFRKIALLSCHGGNTPIANLLSRELRHSHDLDIFIFNFGAFDDPRVQATISEGNTFDFHGGEMETSMVMAIDEDLVKLDRVLAGQATGYVFDSKLKECNINLNWIAEDFIDKDGNPIGIGGDPSGASPEKGQIIFAVNIEKMVEGLKYIAGY